jgi:hypothetical protein
LYYFQIDTLYSVPIGQLQSGGSFSGVSRRASRSPSPASSRERSRSFDQNGPVAYFNTNGPLVNLSLDRNSSDDSLNSGSNRSSFSSGVGNNITIPSPGSSSSPRSPISPSWNNDVSEVISRSSKGEGTIIDVYLPYIYDSFFIELLQQDSHRFFTFETKRFSF